MDTSRFLLAGQPFAILPRCVLSPGSVLPPLTPPRPFLLLLAALLLGGGGATGGAVDLRAQTTTGPTAAAPSLATPAPTLTPEHEAIAFLVGDWITTSEFPDGRTAEGRLSYRWVFDGGWMKVEFRGDHPDGRLWEAHAMQRWDPDAGAYESWSFRADDVPLHYRGSAPEPGLYRIEIEGPNGSRSGIDYHRRDDGTVYQENWAINGMERRITLRTTYRAAEGGVDES